MNVRLRALILLGMTALLFVHPVHSQEKQQSQKGKTSQTKKAAKPRGRLPNNFGRLGIADEQRNKIYRVQESYRTEIAKLLKQLEELRSKRDKEIEAVLTPAQKSRLEEIRAEAKRKRAKKSGKQKKAAKPKAG